MVGAAYVSIREDLSIDGLCILVLCDAVFYFYRLIYLVLNHRRVLSELIGVLGRQTSPRIQFTFVFLINLFEFLLLAKILSLIESDIALVIVHIGMA